MWKVNSESGQLNAVLIQDSVESFWEDRLPFEGIESNLFYTPKCHHPNVKQGHQQWLQLKKFLLSENIQVFETVNILKKGIENSTLDERKEIVEYVWGKNSNAPTPDELQVEHLIYGYPLKPYYDLENDSVILPDFRRVAWPYSRDTSFTTQVGTVICKMQRYSRLHEPKIVKLAYQLDPILREKIELIYDANETEFGLEEPGFIEGGDTQIIDEETIVIGVGQRSTNSGFKKCAEELFKNDPNGKLRYICAVQLPDFPAVDYMHLDVIINHTDKRQALVMPYVWDTNIIADLPPKKLLLKTLDSSVIHSVAHGRPLSQLVTSNAFKNCGRTRVYVKGHGKLVESSSEISLLDFLIKEEKLEKDNILYVGGKPKKEYDVDHLYSALSEQAKGACNVITLKTRKVIAFKRNEGTLKELRDNGITVLEWEDNHFDMLGGPHCSTSPLSRDP
jgi:arginine deiminase